MLVIQVVVTVSCKIAAAEEIDPEAKTFYEEGKAHFEAGRFEEALAAFNEAYNRTTEPKLLFNLGAAAEGMKDRERAKAYYQVYLEELPDAEDADEVRARIEKLSREPEATPTEAAVEAPTATEIAVALNTENIDPREYYETDKKAKKRGPVWPVAAIGVGGMVLAGGIITAILAKTNYDGLKITCSPDCTDDQVSTAKNPAIAADILFGVGAIATTAGIIGLVLSKKKRKESPTAMRILPSPMAGGGGMTVGGRF
jgi:tetratricopeptide (TPR) repeat protein